MLQVREQGGKAALDQSIQQCPTCPLAALILGVYVLGLYLLELQVLEPGQTVCDFCLTASMSNPAQNKILWKFKRFLHGGKPDTHTPTQPQTCCMNLQTNPGSLMARHCPHPDPTALFSRCHSCLPLRQEHYRTIHILGMPN